MLVRYEFPLKRVFDSLIDLPFALPTAVAGLVYANLYVQNGWLGRFLVPLGIQGGLFAVGDGAGADVHRPAVRRADGAAGAGDDSTPTSKRRPPRSGRPARQTFRRVLLPSLLPALITGFALSLARSLGEYGSVVFVSGNMLFKTEIAPVLIVAQLEEFHYAEATAIAVVLLAVRSPCWW